jgi:hypothetical protein
MLEGEVTVNHGVKRLLGRWIVSDGVIRVRVADHTREAPVGGMAKHPEPLARLLVLEIAREHFPIKAAPSHWSRRTG